MNREQFKNYLQEFYTKALAIVDRKNADYANELDPFHNFRAAQTIGIDAARGILLRKLDKIVRISNLLERDPAVVEESVFDALADDANYSAILAALLFEKKSNENKKDGGCLNPPNFGANPVTPAGA